MIKINSLLMFKSSNFLFENVARKDTLLEICILMLIRFYTWLEFFIFFLCVKNQCTFVQFRFALDLIKIFSKGKQIFSFICQMNEWENKLLCLYKRSEFHIRVSKTRFSDHKEKRRRYLLMDRIWLNLFFFFTKTKNNTDLCK